MRAMHWVPSQETIQKTHLYQLMQTQGVNNYEQIHRWSVANPESFWQYTLRQLNIAFNKPFEQLLDVSAGVTQARWLKGAELNIVQSCFQGVPDSLAIITRRRNGNLETISMDHLNRSSNQVANGLAGLGLGKGDAIAMDMPMTAEAVAIYLGIIKAGAVVVSIPESLPAEEIGKRLRIGNAKAVFTQDTLTRAGKTLPLYQKLCDTNAPQAIVVSENSDHAVSLREGDVRWEAFLSQNEAFQPISCPPDHPINILFSSGTTGDPKAIPWDHTTPIKSASDAMYHQDIHAGDVVCWPTSLGWMMGPWLVFAALINKATIALYEGAPTEYGFCQFVQDASVTMLGLVPSIVKSWRSHGTAEGFDWQHLRAYSSSGEASNPEDYGWLMTLNQPDGSPKPIIEYCGGTETGGGYITASLLTENHPATFHAKAMGLDFVVLNEAGSPCEVGEAGEAFLIPPSIGLSTRLLNADNTAIYYQNCPAIEGKTLRRHGDQIIVVADNRFQSDGRADDTMNLGGIKVGSVEIERTLNSVAGIFETAAIAVGTPSQLIICAVLTPHVTQLKHDGLQQALQQQLKNLNPLFRIQDVWVVESLPRTASNKIMRRILRQQYEARQHSAALAGIHHAMQEESGGTSSGSIPPRATKKYSK